MNPISRFFIRRRLSRTMRPDPEYRINRLRQFTPERVDRYWRIVRSIG